MPIHRDQVPSFQVQALRFNDPAPGHERPTEACIAQAEKLALVLWSYADVLVDVTRDGRIVLETTTRGTGAHLHAAWVVDRVGGVSLPICSGEVLFFLATRSIPWNR